MARTQVQSELIATNAISGTIIADGAITSTHLAANCVDSSELVTGSIDTIHIAANQVTATKIVTNGVLTRHISDDQVTAAKLANSINTDIATGPAALPKAGGTMTGNIAHAGDFTLDIAGDIILDAAGQQIIFASAGTNVGQIDMAGTDLEIKSLVNNADLFIRGTDGGSEITALTFDMSDAGKATFNGGIVSTQPNAFGACSFNEADLSNVGTVFADQYLGDADTDSGIVMQGSNVMTLHTGNSERIRIDASGHVGIGMTAASVGSDTVLALYNSATPRIKLHNSTTGTASGDGGEINMSSTNLIIENREAANIKFYTNGSQRFNIDNRGNLSFGSQTSDPVWSQFFNAISSNYGGHVSFQNNGFPVTRLGNNWYINNSTQNQRVTANPAQEIVLTNTGNFEFNTVATGTAGSTFSFTNKMLIANAGSVHIGTTSEATGSTGGCSFSVDNNNRRNFICATTGTGNLELIEFRNPNGTVGDIKSNGTSTSYNSSSDYRLKENVNYTWDATTRLKQLKPARFNFKTDTDTTLDGFLAHEVSSIVPIAVSGEKDGEKMQSIDHSKLVPLLVKAIQELEARIATLEG